MSSSTLTLYLGTEVKPLAQSVSDDRGYLNALGFRLFQTDTVWQVPIERVKKALV